MKIAGIYLAAGKSSRMGSDKIKLPVGKMTLGSLALETALASKLDKIYIITKASDDVQWIPDRMKSDEKCMILTCITSDRGQSASLHCGIRQAQVNQMDAVLIMLADQPFITTQMLDEVIRCARTNPTCKFVATTYEKTIMPPILFSAVMYEKLLTIRGDLGARSILHGDFLNDGKQLPCSDKRLVFDVDTPKDYEFIQNNIDNIKNDFYFKKE